MEGGEIVPLVILTSYLPRGAIRSVVMVKLGVVGNNLKLLTKVHFIKGSYH